MPNLCISGGLKATNHRLAIRSLRVARRPRQAEDDERKAQEGPGEGAKGEGRFEGTGKTPTIGIFSHLI